MVWKARATHKLTFLTLNSKLKLLKVEKMLATMAQKPPQTLHSMLNPNIKQDF